MSQPIPLPKQLRETLRACLTALCDRMTASASGYCLSCQRRAAAARRAAR